jgi:hypothetical protein
MRLWSLDLKLLDSKGLVALWRETLLAKNVLEGKTKGYINHPQLDRFKKSSDPLEYINRYLSLIYKESQERGYNFDSLKFKETDNLSPIEVTDKQLEFEFNHLQNKLKIRDEVRYKENRLLTLVVPNSLFRVVPGEIEEWERV